MTYNQHIKKMQILTKEIREGKHNGKTVWICHYNQPDLNKKPLRSIPPTKVIVKPISESPSKIYYSESFFVPLSAKGTELKKAISPVDNTGFRSNIGNELYVFDNEPECVAEWNKQLEDHIVKVDDMIINATSYWQDQKDSLLSKKVT